MASKRTSRRKEDEIKEDEDAKKETRKAWLRDILIGVIVLAVVLGGMYAYTGVWPPLVVVESSSMQHGDTTSYIGVLDTGDLILVQAAPTRADVSTYIQGRSAGYSTYGDYGDVIIFRIARDPSATPVSHRAIMYVIPNGSRADIPELNGLATTEWQGYRNGTPVGGAYGLTGVTIHRMGYDHNLGITFNLASFVGAFRGKAGYITMGDNNAYHNCATLDPCTGVVPPYDTSWFPTLGDVIGHARGEIPWFGLIKLLLSPSSTCCVSWGDPRAPVNSWNDLAISIVVLIALPFLIDGAVWFWSTYAWPRIKPYVPRIRDRKQDGMPKEKMPLPKDREEPPRDGPSGP